MTIHPTAIIAPSAKIDPSVTIGPYTIIDDNVVINAHVKIASHVRIYAHTQIGSHNQIDHGAILGADPQDHRFDNHQATWLKIGNHNTFREGVNIHRGSAGTIIGDHNYFMGNFHVGHDCILGNHNTFAHGSVLAGHVRIGNKNFISGLVAVHQFCHIGNYTMIAGCAKIVKDVPPFATADGNPATLIGINSIGLKRAGFDAKSRQAIKQAYQRIYRQGLGLQVALQQLEQHPLEQIQQIVQFYQNSQRGVTKHR